MASKSDVIAVVTELGSLALLNVGTLSLIKNWQVHKNAIFDVSWRPGEVSHVLTSSGDQSICLFDVYSGLLNPLF